MKAFSNESVMGYINSDANARTQLLDIARSGKGLGNKSDSALMELINQRVAEGGQGSAGFLLQNLQNAGTDINKISKLLLGDSAYAEMANLKNTVSDANRRNIPPPAVTTNNNTVNVSGILDQRVVDRIVEELNRMNTSNRERGAVNTNTNTALK